jgi:hypothetical protein
MDSNKKNPKEQPFFAQFLEDQDVAEAQGGAGTTTTTLKYPSDRDETVTMKYPSDDDEVYQMP